MPKDSIETKPVKTSEDILLAEHQRLSSLYLNNVEMGEKRTTLYLTLVSFGSGVLAAITKLAPFDKEFVKWASFGLVIGIFLLGLLTYQRLLERRIRAIEYLRAINRIHRFFVLQDATIKDYFYWSASDDVPTFLARSTQLTGLRDIVGCFNSLFAGVGTGGLIKITGMAVTYRSAVGFGLVVTTVMVVLHLIYERKVLGKIERNAAKAVKFPRADS
jgi:hypothetical protein